MPLSSKSACLFRRGVGAADISQRAVAKCLDTHTKIKCDEIKEKKRKDFVGLPHVYFLRPFLLYK